MLVPSRYNYEVQCDGRRYLYNMLSVGLIELQDGMSIGDICKSDPNAELQLKSLGFLVEDGCDEFAKYQYFFDAKRYGEASRRIKIVLIPTYGCNLRCPYCYQGEDKSSNRLGQVGAERILRFLDTEASRLKSNNAIESINISLFGGEPMMDKIAISRFCEGAIAIARRVMIPIQFDMTTNLTLLDRQMVELIKQYSVFTQVTLDGPRQYHDKRRVTDNGVGTYDRILKNLKWLNEEGLKKYVQIRINVDNETISHCDEILNDIDGLYSSVYFSVIVHHSGANDCHENLCVKEANYSTFVTKANEVLSSRGLPVHRSFGKRSPCALVCPGQYFIDCNFDVYGCDCLINHPECKIGVIDESGVLMLNQEYYKQLNVTVTNTKKCRQCKWAPACGGGCPATKYINDGGINGNLECQCIVNQESLDDYLRDYIRRNNTF